MGVGSGETAALRLGRRCGGLGQELWRALGRALGKLKIAAGVHTGGCRGPGLGIDADLRLRLGCTVVVAEVAVTLALLIVLCFCRMARRGTSQALPQAWQRRRWPHHLLQPPLWPKQQVRANSRLLD